MRAVALRLTTMDVALPRRPRGKRLPATDIALPPEPKKASAAPELADWTKWQATLARRSPIDLPGGNRGSESSLLWGTAGWLDDAASESLRRLHTLLRAKKLRPSIATDLQRWLSTAITGATSPQACLESLAWCYRLPDLAQVVPDELWRQTLDYLHSTAISSSDTSTKQPLLFQLQAVELAATLARLFPELPCAADLAASAQRASSAYMQSVLDEDGLLSANLFGLMQPLWASWVRCRLIETGGRSTLFDENSRTRIDKFFQHTLRMTRSSGSPIFSPPSASGESPLLAATEAAAATTDTRKLAKAVRARASNEPDPKGLPHPAWYSEIRGLALLRNRWSAPVDQASVRFFAADVDVEWQAAGQTIGSGAWSWQASANGKTLQADGNWEEVCWHSDADVDYLELELPLSGGWVLQRQILLARRDRFLHLADILIGNEAKLTEPADLRYAYSWPLFGDVRFEPNRDTREGFLVSGKRRLATVLPLALPEWRAEYCHAELKATEAGELQLSLAARGRNLYAPLWIDLDPRRSQQPYTWRRLTVAEQLETQPRDAAVGYRVQAGAQQWLVYRALTDRGNRTVLGQNYSTEFVVSRFQSDGQTVGLIDIQ